MIHGGDIYSNAYKGKIIDFSSNINPLGPPEKLKEELEKAYSELTAYPDINYRELKSNIAEYLRCSLGEVVLGNGAVEIINNVCLMFDRIIVFTPCFSEYIKRPAILGKEVKTLPLDHDFKINIKSIEDSLKKGDVLILGNPNNPTGLRIPEEELKRIYSIVKQKDAFLLLDEAFFEFCPKDYDSVELFRGKENICVIRAATKFFALPGIRLGYGATSTAFAEKYGEVESPWSVNSYANAAARCIFRDKEYIEKTKQNINRERDYLFKELFKIQWVKPYKSNSNFILIKLLKYDENIIFDQFIKAGIMIRRASNFEDLDHSYIRIAVKDHQSNKKLIKLFQEFE